MQDEWLKIVTDIYKMDRIRTQEEKCQKKWTICACWQQDMTTGQ